jgi:spore coat polysaccharide biosynthesis predicted glycosyltransferase SpsG
MSKIYFRTAGGPSEGWGNIIRLTSFAEACRERGTFTDITFFVEGPDEIQEYVKKREFKVVAFSSGISVKDEHEHFEKEAHADFLIVEMLNISFARQKMLKKHANKLIVFDDLLDHRYCADLVVSGQALPSYGNKDISSLNTQFLVGLQYFLCRPMYDKHIGTQREYSTHIKKVLVTLGGGDYAVANIKVAYALQEFGTRLVPIFILGYAMKESLKAEIQDILPHAIVCGGVDDIDEYFMATDFAIVSAGYNKIEAAVTRTPSLMIAVQWHQIPLATEFEKLCGMPYLGYMSYVKVKDIIECIKKYDSHAKRYDLAHNLERMVDCKGMDRVYSAIFGKFEGV